MSRLLSIVRVVLPLAALFILIGAFGANPTFAAGVVGTGTPASCTEGAFDSKLTGGGLITFNCGPNPYTLKLSANKTITLDTTIDGANKITLKIKNSYHFQVQTTHALTLKNIIMTGGNSNGAGSIENFGTFTALHVTFKNNRSLDQGGAIYNNGKVLVKQSTFLNNQAVTGGGAIYNDGGTTIIKTSTFSGNLATGSSSTGGTLGSNGGTMKLIKSTISHGSASEGGGVWTQYGTTNLIKKSTIQTSTATNAGGGGIENYGDTKIVNSKIMNNIASFDGGGIKHGGSLELSKSTVSGNKASLGGGMRDFGNSTDVQQSTFSGNQAKTDGGGIYTSAALGVRNSTFSGNSAGTAGGNRIGGAIFAYNTDINLEYVTVANNTAPQYGGVYSDGVSNSSIYMQNTALSNNANGNCGGATIVSGGYNLSSDSSCSSEFNQTGDKNNKNAKLGALANNGGPTQTHLPLATSPLINKGLTDNHITIDQRNFKRPVGSSADIGAVEVQ